MKQRKELTRKGFSLVELLAVLAVLAIMSVLIVAGTRKVIGMSHAAKCSSNLRAMGSALVLYAKDHSGQLPPSATLPWTGYQYKFQYKTFWFDALNPYMGYPQFSAERSKPFPAPSSVGEGFPLGWQLCPAKNVESAQRQSVGYGWNGSNFGWDKTRAATSGFGRRLSDIEDPARTIIIGDSKDEEVNVDRHYEHRYIYDYEKESRIPYPRRHNGGGNYLFADGHVGTYAPEFMSTPEGIQLFRVEKE